MPNPATPTTNRSLLLALQLFDPGAFTGFGKVPGTGLKVLKLCVDRRVVGDPNHLNSLWLRQPIPVICRKALWTLQFFRIHDLSLVESSVM